jgi:hypothetical protein
VGAAIPAAFRVTPDHLADGNLGAATDLGEALLVQHILDDAVLQSRERRAESGERRAESREQSAASREQESRRAERRAQKAREQSAESRAERWQQR